MVSVGMGAGTQGALVTDTTDLLVIGGGLAGHQAALEAARRGARVTLAYLSHGASPYIIGCNFLSDVARGDDSPARYAEDMIRGGHGLNDRRIVARFTALSAGVLRELRGIGIPFSEEDDRLRLRHLSGNSVARSVFVPEGTGRAILFALGEAVRVRGVTVLSGTRAIRLLRCGGAVTGALFWDRRRKSFHAIGAGAVVLATGGIGRLYEESTYPSDIAASSYGMALEAGATLIDMEFVQFEPVVTVWPEACRGMEMPTAMLGDGAQLLNVAAERFMFRYNPDGGERGIEKARMALCIQQEIDEGRGLPDGSVLFDTRCVPSERLESYVSHCRRLRKAGVEPRTCAPHVRPSAHSQMGGIAVDEAGWSGVAGLYAAGEAAGGLHGASRIAGNGCSDALVSGAIAGVGAADGWAGHPVVNPTTAARDAVETLRATVRPGRNMPPLDAMRASIAKTMAAAAGLHRNGPDLARAQTRIETLAADLDGVTASDLGGAVEIAQLRHLSDTALAILGAAGQRRESRGAHFRSDFPAIGGPEWLVHLGYRRQPGGRLSCHRLPIH